VRIPVPSEGVGHTLRRNSGEVLRLSQQFDRKGGVGLLDLFDVDADIRTPPFGNADAHRADRRDGEHRVDRAECTESLTAFDDVEEPLVEPQLELAAPNAAWAVDNAPSTCCWPDATA